MQKLKIGDTVQVTAGAERTEKNKASKRGKVVSIDWQAGRLKVEGLRLVKRHLKKGRERANPEGGILERPGTIAVASVALVCPKCQEPTRVGVKQDEGKNARFCKNCQAVID
jgi:large subunit ribosomal protein L24